MFYTMAFDLVVLWLLGVFTSHTFGGVIYILLGVAIILIFVNIVDDHHMRIIKNMNSIV